MAEPDTLEFQTDGTWAAHELADLLDDLDATYRTVRVAKHLAVSHDRQRNRSLDEQERYWRDCREMGPEWEMLIHEWTRWLRHSHKGRMPPPLIPFSPFATGSAANDAQPALDAQFALEHSDTLLTDGHELQVTKIQMASPGGFSLSGLGEPLTQLRELIKDLWYRNRQEREQGELELLQRRIEMFSQHGLPPQQVLVLAIEVSDNQDVVRDLIESGKLILDGEEPRGRNRIESPKTKRKTKRRTIRKKKRKS